MKVASSALLQALFVVLLIASAYSAPETMLDAVADADMQKGGSGVSLQGRAITDTIKITTRYTGPDLPANGLPDVYGQIWLDFIVLQVNTYLINRTQDCFVVQEVTSFGGTNFDSIVNNWIFKNCSEGTAQEQAQGVFDDFNFNGTNIDSAQNLTITEVAAPTVLEPTTVTGDDAESDFPLALALISSIGGLVIFCLILVVLFVFIFLIFFIVVVIVVVVVGALLISVGMLVMGVGFSLKRFVYSNIEPPEAGDEDQDLWSDEESDDDF